MTSGERENLIKLAKLRGTQAKREVDARLAEMKSDIQNDITAEHQANEELWAEAVTIANEAVEKANSHIRTQCSLLGIPPEHAPKVQMAWQSRSSEFADPKRRAELRKLAETRLDARRKRATAEIDRRVLDAEAELRSGTLESAEARAFAEGMPSADELLPPLTLDGLGVHCWHPPKDASGKLLRPVTATERKRLIIARMIDSDPEASDRAIAERSGCDHKTVARVRESMDGEIPGIGPGVPGEIPSGDGDAGEVTS